MQYIAEFRRGFLIISSDLSSSPSPPSSFTRVIAARALVGNPAATTASSPAEQGRFLYFFTGIIGASFIFGFHSVASDTICSAARSNFDLVLFWGVGVQSHGRKRHR